MPTQFQNDHETHNVTCYIRERINPTWENNYIGNVVVIEDVTSRSSGYFASLFDFGDIYIQTAGTNANIELLKTPKSVEVENIINDLIRG